MAFVHSPQNQGLAWGVRPFWLVVARWLLWWKIGSSYAFSRSANVRVACDVAYYYIIYNDITIYYTAIICSIYDDDAFYHRYSALGTAPVFGVVPLLGLVPFRPHVRLGH